MSASATQGGHNQHSSIRTATEHIASYMCVRIIVHNCRTRHSTCNSSDNFPSHSDNHHSWVDVYWIRGRSNSEYGTARLFMAA